MTVAIETAERLVGRAGRQVRLLAVRRELFRAAQRGGAAEHHEIDQRVGAEPVGAMHRNAGRFAHRHQARHHEIVVAVLLGQRLAVEVGRNPAHVVMRGRHDRDRLARHIDIGKNPR